jgi:hypothetical protein
MMSRWVGKKFKKYRLHMGLTCHMCGREKRDDLTYGPHMYGLCHVISRREESNFRDRFWDLDDTLAKFRGLDSTSVCHVSVRREESRFGTYSR